MLKADSSPKVAAPDVSVLLQVRDGFANYPPGQFERALASVLEQEGVRVQVCATDDASSDGSGDLLEEWATHEARVVVAHNRSNRGIAESANVSATMATGRYFVISSVRAEYMPGYFKACVEALDANPDVGFVYGQTKYHGARVFTHQPPPYRRDQFMRKFPSFFGYLYRREAWERGCRYRPYIEREGKVIDIADRDFLMQLICDLGWEGMALPEVPGLRYLYSGRGQMTALVHKYHREVKAAYEGRFPEAVYR